jgi:hypothetical protein
MSIEVRDDGGPVMQLRFTFNIIKQREKHRQEPREWDGPLDSPNNACGFFCAFLITSFSIAATAA